ncbi:MAG: hypothetical protein EOO38_32015 [Cytophagaceae bacterium]|nr:MAG: hypothetical protein EOO38_32015 [Cytophagaceae bacterium]
MALEENYPSPTAGYSLEQRLQVMWALLAVGLLCFLLAEPVGTAFATTKEGNGYSISTEAAHTWTLKIYLLGGVSLLAGFVERIAIEIASLKRKEKT